MNVVNILNSMVMYYHATRRAGHTKILFTGIDNFGDKSIHVVGSYRSSLVNKNRKDVYLISLDDLPEKLKGLSLPITFDNWALHILFSEIVKSFNELYSEIGKKERRIEYLEGKLRKHGVSAE